MKNIYFLSGLPRSGSTVLAAILNQHPELHASASSGLLDILIGTLQAWVDSVNSNKSNKEIQRILRTIADCKYDYTDKPIILDNERGWVSKVNINTLENMFNQKPKIIATVRNVPDCVASIVRNSKPVNLEEFLRSDESINYIKQSYQVLEEGYCNSPDCFLFIDYDDLLSNPQKELDRVHKFLGMSDFIYDLEAIDSTSFKESNIKPKLERQHNNTAEEVLGVYYQQYRQLRFWLDEPIENQPIHDLDLQLAAGLIGNFSEGLRLTNKIEKEEPWNHRAAFNRGWYRMYEGRLHEGEELLFRGRLEGVFGNEVPKSPMPIWDGFSVGTVLLTLEGGLGDQIHGVRYVSYIVNRGCDVIVACSGQLCALFRNIYGVRAVIQHAAIFGVIHDFWAPSMSTAMILKLEYKDVNGNPYIEKPVVTKSNKFRIGLRWQGNPQFEHEQHRKFPSNLLFDAVKDVDAEFINLQRDEGVQHTPLWISNVCLDHWGHTRDAIASCDLVITSCTSVAHLSAAMGINTWIIVPILPYYLWAKPGNTTPWYNSVHLYRQTTYNNWEQPFINIKEDISKLLK